MIPVACFGSAAPFITLVCECSITSHIEELTSFSDVALDLHAHGLFPRASRGD